MGSLGWPLSPAEILTGLRSSLGRPRQPPGYLRLTGKGLSAPGLGAAPSITQTLLHGVVVDADVNSSLDVLATLLSLTQTHYRRDSSPELKTRSPLTCRR